MVRILGIDPGSRVTGYGVVELDGGRARAVAWGCIAPPPGPFTGRLHAIFEGVRDVVSTHQPAEAAVEEVFVHRNVAAALKLGQARGAALCAATAAGLPVAEYAPGVVKQAVTGTGRASKAQVAYMVRALLAIREPLAADAADALAVALCHGQHRGRPR
ncbi:crossover junction endodeoxyribonuclease RuvC [Inmirania thermothiophila]|uniref:Crossover junction endodeoxyribonuclease RuvC n=1 Tax=Inmirania thermothiophila TaxID=1750597 RepID=A0A3N1XX61_9GAMM|nr:crossover junction endodeoxyribonuclease RuvC [Inmirania thermothiophila]ROR29802.1 Holliday junction endonuclease RuvC [Inmirania thermothiophila]